MEIFQLSLYILGLMIHEFFCEFTVNFNLDHTQWRLLEMLTEKLDLSQPSYIHILNVANSGSHQEQFQERGAVVNSLAPWL